MHDVSPRPDHTCPMTRALRRALVVAVAGICAAGPGQSLRADAPTSQSYEAYVAEQGSKGAAAVRFAFGGRHFAAEFPIDKDSSRVTLWRVLDGGGTALIGSFTFDKGHEFQFDQDVAVSPDGRHVALIRKEDGDTRGGPLYVRLYDVRDDSRDGERILPGDAGNSRSCGLDFDATGANLYACGTYRVKLDDRGMRTYNPRIHKFKITPGDLEEAGKSYLMPRQDTTYDGAMGFRLAPNGRMVEALIRRGYQEQGKHGSGYVRNSIMVRRTLDNAPAEIYGAIGSLAPTASMVAIDKDRALGSASSKSPLRDIAVGGVRHDRTEQGLKGLRFFGGANRDVSLIPARDGNYLIVLHPAKDGVVRVLHVHGKGLRAAAFVHGTDDLVAVHADTVKVHRVSGGRMAAAALHGESMGLWRNGFSKIGADKMIAAMSRDPALFQGIVHPDPVDLAKDVSTGKLKVDLADAGRVLAAQAMLKPTYAEGVNLRLVTKVTPEGKLALERFRMKDHPLEAAGARVADIIESVNGASIYQAGLSPERALDRSLSAVAHWASVSVTLSRNGVATTYTMAGTPRRISRLQGGQRVMGLMHFGLLAIQAGHPGIARQALAVLKNVMTENISKTGHILETAAAYPNLLEGAIAAAEGGAEQGYAAILAAGGLQPEKMKLTVDTLFDFAQATAPLFKDRGKLAYLTGRKETDIRAPRIPHDRAPVPYPDLNGNMIQPASAADAAAAPQEKPTPAAKTAKPAKPVGKVLD
ncbi:hypothetical protein KFF05_02045 [bacterium SCSIO 12827]|nr:hypothetical protein KFF05_02045 [bacterium SCSIO 12827]